MEHFTVSSPNVKYTDKFIESDYIYQVADVKEKDGNIVVTPTNTQLKFRTERLKPKLGCMLVGWGGNNGSTVTASNIANQKGMSWHTKDGIQHANFLGSITQTSTLSLGRGPDGKEVFIPFNNILPMVDPTDIMFDGWDISSMNLADAMDRAQVLEYELKQKLRPFMVNLRPRPSIYSPTFIAANQKERADNILQGTKREMLLKVRADIQDFKKSKNLDKVIVLWTANTERFSDIKPGLNTTARELEQSIDRNATEISPSTLFAVASILEGCAYINGSPQNTFVPGVIELATERGVMIAGNDFKSGQTKLKSVLVDFLVSAGIKPLSIVSYNHLGNNDGKNLSAPQQFRSKELSKSNVVDDVVDSNHLMYKEGEKPDHCVVIKYVPVLADSKRAMDEYTSEIMMGGRNTLVIYNTCEDSLLAGAIILDLVILTEICQRISLKLASDCDFESFYPALSILGYLCKAPLVPPGTPVVNALFKQRACIENIFRACIGLPPQSYMTLEHKFSCLNPARTEAGSLNVDSTVTGALANGCLDLTNGSPPCQASR